MSDNGYAAAGAYAVPKKNEEFDNLQKKYKEKQDQFKILAQQNPILKKGYELTRKYGVLNIEQLEALTVKPEDQEALDALKNNEMEKSLGAKELLLGDNKNNKIGMRALEMEIYNQKKNLGIPYEDKMLLKGKDKVTQSQNKEESFLENPRGALQPKQYNQSPIAAKVTGGAVKPVETQSIASQPIASYTPTEPVKPVTGILQSGSKKKTLKSRR